MGRGDKENRRGWGEGYCTQTIRKFCRKPGHGGSIPPVIGQHLGMKGDSAPQLCLVACGSPRRDSRKSRENSQIPPDLAICASKSPEYLYFSD